MDAITVQTDSVERTMALAQSMAMRLEAGDVLALAGPLGSGKTCFVRGLVRGLGLDEQAVSSPTFLICQEYRSQRTDGQRLTLAHIDAYRLHHADDLASIGWDELLEQSDVITAVEWADRIESELPDRHVRVEFEHVGENERRITVTDVGHVPSRFVDLEASVEQARATTPCPICSTSVTAGVATFPFCSQRCRMVDLGRWFSGSRVISRPLREDDLDRL